MNDELVAVLSAKCDYIPCDHRCPYHSAIDEMARLEDENAVLINALALSCKEIIGKSRRRPDVLMRSFISAARNG